MLESAIQSKIIKALEDLGCYVVKVMVANRPGTPDLLISYRGQFYGIEVKNATGKPSKLQIYHGELIERSGGKFGIVRSVLDALKLIGVADYD
jgi:Holliday junction resolvase